MRAETDFASRAQSAAALPDHPRKLSHGNGIAPFTAVLWDMDGTISDSAAGITQALSRTFAILGIAVANESALRSFVGPPILETFRAHGLTEKAQLDEALAIYRKIYSDGGLLNAPIYDGVGDVIRAVRAAKIAQSTATSKPESSAKLVLAKYQIADQFDFITGASDDEKLSKKADVVAEALNRLDGAGLDLSNVLMIGDRHYDVTGAGFHGVPTTYVTWGYGSAGEEEGAVSVVDNAAQLYDVLGLPKKD